MAYTPKHGDFTLYKNDRKREGQKDPDYSGNIYQLDENGELAKFFLDGWIREGKHGKFISGKIGNRMNNQ